MVVLPLPGPASTRGPTGPPGRRRTKRTTAAASAAPPTMSTTRAGERHVRHAAGRGGCLDHVVPLEALQPVPQAFAPAEQDRDHRDVHVVDEPCGDELADRGRTPADSYVLAARRLAGRRERLG